MKKQLICLCIPGILICAQLSAQITIPPGFYGGNWWHSDYRGAPFGINPSPQIDPPNSTAVSLFATTGASTMRSGGIAWTVRTSDDQDPDNRAFPIRAVDGQIVPNPAGYVKLVDDIRAAGYEPMLTVPFDDRSKTRTIEEQALEAADIVRTVNKVHKRNVKYWIIANEPEQSQGYWGTAAQVEQVRRYTRVFAMHMKNADPDIVIMGPELEWANKGSFRENYSPVRTIKELVSETRNPLPTRV